MTNSNTVSDLAERCEAATGPDRELDCAIAVALGRTDEGGSGFHRTFPDDSVFEQVRALLFTASLDAAMTLVPEGWVIGSVAEEAPRTQWVVELRRGHRTSYDKVVFSEYTPGKRCASFALALCAAALKARASTGDA
jgi:hypothetical protein